MQQLICWWYFKLRGWKIEGRFPFELNKSILVVAPHTHSFDFFLGLAIRKKVHIEFVHFLGKKELFWGIFGWILRYLGGYPVERSKNLNQVDQVVNIFNQKEQFHIAISPEGTRKKVGRLKSGFYHIAKNANVPILMVALNFKHKKVTFAPPFMVSGDEKEDKQKIVRFFKGILGYIPEYSITEDIEG
jgi:1-acyl-sn-glycerol-3-phosphate acyltransferase